MPNNLTARLAQCTVASCRCMTKTPEVQYHEPTCLYRVLNEAIQVIDAAQPNEAARDAQFEVWFAQNYPSLESVPLKPALKRAWAGALAGIVTAMVDASANPAPMPPFRGALFHPDENSD